MYRTKLASNVSVHNTMNDKRVHWVTVHTERDGAHGSVEHGVYEVKRTRCPVSGVDTWEYRNGWKRGRPAISKNARVLREALHAFAVRVFREHDQIENRLG